MRGVELKLHRYAGLAAAVFVSAVAVSGALMVLEGTLLPSSFVSEEYSVEPREERAPVDGVLDEIERRYGMAPVSLSIRAEPDRPDEYRLDRRRTVLVDPYSGGILGEEADFRTRFSRTLWTFHASLLLGEPGRWIVGLSTTVLLISVVTGLIIGTRAVARGGMRVLSLRRTGSGRVWNRRFHNALGLAVAPVLIVIAATGCFIAFEPLQKGVLQLLGASPRLGESSYPISVPRGTVRATADSVLEEVGAHDRRAEASTVRLYFPRNAEDAFRVEISGVRGTRKWVFVDQHSGERLADPHAEIRARTESTRWGIRTLHYGSYFGPVAESIWLLACLSVPAFTLSGVLIWSSRRASPRRKERCSKPSTSTRPMTEHARSKA